jgi:hypothetical protein
MTDRRNDDRISTHRRGVIKFGPAGQELACTVDDLTMVGAGLHVATTFGLPKVFRLTVDGEPKPGIAESFDRSLVTSSLSHLNDRSRARQASLTQRSRPSRTHRTCGKDDKKKISAF